EIYMSYVQSPMSRLTLLVRTKSDPAKLGPLVREAIWSVDKDQPVYSIKTMDAQLGEMTAQRRLNTLLLGSSLQWLCCWPVSGCMESCRIHWPNKPTRSECGWR